MTNIQRLTTLAITLTLVAGFMYLLPYNKSNAQINDKSKYVTKKVNTDNKKSIEQVQKILDRNGVQIDARELFSRGWKSKLESKKNQLQSINLNRKAKKLKGLETADTLELDEKTYIEDNTVLIVNNLKLKGEKPVIKGPHGIHIFVLGKVQTDSADTKITISADGLGREDWLKMKKKDMSDGFDYSKFYASYNSKKVSEKKEVLAKILKEQKNPYISYFNAGFNSEKMTIEEYIDKNPSLFKSILQSSDGTNGRDGNPGTPGNDGVPGNGGTDGSDGVCSSNPNGVDGGDGQIGGDGQPGGDGGDGDVGGHAGIINFTIDDPNDTNSYTLSAKGGNGGYGAQGGKGGDGKKGGNAGDGGDGASCSCTPPVVGTGGTGGDGGDGGDGAQGGDGGDGQNGGNGGTITITYPSGYNTNNISTDIRSGTGGTSGTSGQNGAIGQGGIPGAPGVGGALSLCGISGNNGNSGSSGNNGSSVITGSNGEAGSNGNNGTVLRNENSGSCPGGGGSSSFAFNEFYDDGLRVSGPNNSSSFLEFYTSKKTTTFCGGECNVQEFLRCENNNGAWDDSTCTCYPTPIILDLNGDGFSLTNADNGVLFDISNKGSYDQVAWTSANSDDAFLVLDRNDNGTIDSGAELFGNLTPQPEPPANEGRNGFLALAVYDKTENGGNGDGKITQADTTFGDLRIWKDTNHNGISETNEFHTLSSLDVNEIDLKYKESKKVDIHGNKFRYRSKLKTNNNSNTSKWAWDVYLTTKTIF